MRGAREWDTGDGVPGCQGTASRVMLGASCTSAGKLKMSRMILVLSLATTGACSAVVGTLKMSCSSGACGVEKSSLPSSGSGTQSARSNSCSSTSGRGVLRARLKLSS